jgi:hypothetical protein
MKIYFILILFVVAPVLLADSWAPPKASGYASRSGQYLLRILPGGTENRQTAVALIYELDRGGLSYNKKKEFALANNQTPVDACISDTGEIFTFDDWGSLGHSYAVVHYSADGTLKQDYSLDKLIPEKLLVEIKKTRRSISSIRWRTGVPYMVNDVVVVPFFVAPYI